MAKIDQVLGGLKILKAQKTDTEFSVEGHHDLVLVGPIAEDVVSEDDAEELDGLDWVYDEDREGWVIFT